MQGVRNLATQLAANRTSCFLCHQLRANIHSTSSKLSSARSFRINGLCGPPVTPFKANGDLNLEMVPALVQHFVDYNVLNAFVTGSNGEGMSMSVNERKWFVEAWVKQSKGKLKANIIQIGAGNIRDSQALAEHAQEIGADAIACVGTSYFKPETVESYVSYMAAVAEAAPKLPFFLYDIQVLSGINIVASDFMSLGRERIPTLAGLKHTTADFTSMGNILREHGDEFQVIMGTDQLYLEGLVIGLDTTVCVPYIGNVLNRVKEAYDKGDLQTARMEQNRALSIGAIRRKHGLSFADGTKAVLRALGLEVGPTRLPSNQVSQDTVDNLRKDLEDIGYFQWGTTK